MTMQAIALGLLGAVSVLLILLRCFAADVYDVVIVWMTAKWYAAVFDRLSRGDRVLDVGIGTATALVKNKASLLEKRLSVVGIDYEAAYVRKAETVLRAADLWRAVPEGTEGYRQGEFYCRVLEGSIYDSDLPKLCATDGGVEGSKDPRDAKGSVPEELRYDAAYFSGSLTVMPDPPAALRAVVPLIKQTGGRVFITQTFNKRQSKVMTVVKPLLKYITTIDFGQLTTEEDLNRIIKDAGCFETLENKPIEGSVDNPWQTARLIILKPKATG
mmetsp:Transcript_86896/g.218760  ORF Transcript_86896/g.218760 Transcript_86896/m.218760 type:complete len:272 (-) Transcript_86896:50-865(-)|eukprot:CAMPEP_0115589322 /NCGR_PEP_ID=MMETSP0272-20121206/9188_1 /TAXON_ID=71861 /ORGANISM="Scrippsiella trochoidea, Strain CCMP3099" /LENGTH=271 /DNA_ID=CAMNT_0003024481 /DNA_START=64 /DNA_END=879 /DNA_ORIENTATION=+